METKPVILSSSGLKNIVLNKYQDDEDFVFIFGEQEFRMKSFFAEFISPFVSHLHQADPTITKLNFSELNTTNNPKITELCKTVLTSEIISLLQQISSGFTIEIDEEQSIKLHFLSILLGNEELHSKLNELFPQNFTEENANSYLKNIECCYQFSQFKPDFDFTSLLTFIASHFYKLNKEIFLNLPRKIQHQIISHPQLQIESEDSLFDIILEIIEKKDQQEKQEEEIDDVLFFEQIEFRGLSEDRLRTFVDVFDVNEINGLLWQKLSECFFSHSNKKSKRIASEYKTRFFVGGAGKSSQLAVDPNNKDEDGEPIISPPVMSSLDPSSLLSYSVYGEHSVIVTSDQRLLGIGYNGDGRISNTLIKTEICHFTEFSINDKNGLKLNPYSAVCGDNGTLYMFSKNNEKENDTEMQLVYCDKDINKGTPIFLDIGDIQPVSLFGGGDHSAAISNEGEVIFINRLSVKNSPESRINSVSLPDGEKASFVACCEDSVVVLSTIGHVFSSLIDKVSNVLKFERIEELQNYEIVCLSGTSGHCIAVSKEGRAFGRGSNDRGQLGLDKQTELVTSFTEIESLYGFKIRAAYAGWSHSLFETFEGKILSCGDNLCGQLLLSSGPGEDVYSPAETTISKDATFCITGALLTAVFTRNGPPPNTPNKRI